MVPPSPVRVTPRNHPLTKRHRVLAELGSLLLLIVLLTEGPVAGRRELSLGDRIDCQRTIERVYYGHQQGATRAFEEAVSEGLLEQMVRTSLKQSVALEEMWSTPVKALMLEAEVARIRRASRLPGRLEEIEEALGHDPLLVQECFARPVLVERLSRNFYDYDERVHGQTRHHAEELREQLVQGRLDPREPHPWRGVMEEHLEEKRAGHAASLIELGENISRVGEDADAFVVDATLPGTSDRTSVARYRVSKRPWSEWWREVEGRFDESRAVTVASSDRSVIQQSRAAGSDPACLADDIWDNGSLDVQPLWTEGPGIWTGTHMLVGGGEGGRPVLKYDPLTDTWSTSAIPSPVNQVRHTAVWTGSVMIVWGGGSAGVNTGGRYDPIADTWAPTSLVNAPSPRWGHTAVWTGSRMIVWGGSTTNTGGLYDPETDTWTPTSTVNAPEPRLEHTAVWTGHRMIVWGGGAPGVGYVTGGQYDPLADTWVPTSTLNVPEKRSGHGAIWTGTDMLVWGGAWADAIQTGGRYDPVTETWRPMSTEAAPQGRFNHTALWTGQVMVVWGGEIFWGGAEGGGRYDPATDTWAPISRINEPDPRRKYAAVWTGDRMVVFGGRDPSPFILRVLPTGGRYDPVNDVWSPTSSTANSPTPRTGHRAVWTGNEMIVWGGCDLYYNAFASGGRYDPLTDSWKSTTILGAPEGRCGHGMVWAGDEMLVWGGDHRIFNASKVLATGGRYDPVSDTWRTISNVGAPQARSNLSALWTGERMIVWGGGGIGEARILNSGAIYDPRADSWTPMTTVGAPEGRYFHSAVWTGDRMVVWGGDTGTGRASYQTGGRYDPATDTWQSMSQVGSPGPRVGHATAWTGEEMFVFSGSTCSISCPQLNSGALYDPRLDTWRSISQAGAPPPKIDPTGIWTGREVLAWGPAGGGRYDPATDSWRPMSSLNAPSGPLGSIRAVWTGTHMIAYGGSGYGGRYVALDDPDDDADGSTACGGDCDDADAATHPGAEELCDGKDNDCDGLVPPAETDADGDGYMACGGDCNDGNPRANPSTAELPGNAEDENCDGVLSCDPAVVWKNRGQFIGCIARACEGLVENRTITREECDALIAKAARLTLR
jgi:N-acetylneuraminic acid mutarotase